jgi:hypothetical protein
VIITNAPLATLFARERFPRSAMIRAAFFTGGAVVVIRFPDRHRVSPTIALRPGASWMASASHGAQGDAPPPLRQRL